MWVMANTGSDDIPQIRARWVAQEFRGRCGDKHECFSETPDLALVNAVIAPAARWFERRDTVVAVFDVHRAYFHAEEKRDTFVELPDYVSGEFRALHVGKLRKALYVSRPAAASWEDELRKGLASCRLIVCTVSWCCFRNESGSVAGAVHGDDILVAGPREEVTKMGAMLKKRWETRDQLIGARSSDLKELHILNRTLRWCQDELVFAADPRHAREVVDELGVNKSKPVTSPVVVDSASRCRDGELRPLDGEEIPGARPVGPEVCVSPVQPLYPALVTCRRQSELDGT